MKYSREYKFERIDQPPKPYNEEKRKRSSNVEYFAKRLTDYDPASNNGNWQGISGTGVDMKPYFRDMNPWIQSAKFDKDAAFIKLWVPELKDVVPKDIHRWNEMCKEVHNKDVKYPCPMVDYAEQKRKMLELYT